MWIFAARWTEQVYVCATLYISDQVNSDWIITMTALYYLIQSFIWKFSQLSNSGVNVELRFNCVNGRVNANLTADIGSSKPESAPRSFSGCKSKPSRIRRRNRRRAARLNENSEKDVNNHHNTSQSSVGEFYSDDNLDTNLASNDVRMIVTQKQKNLPIRLLSFMIIPMKVSRLLSILRKGSCQHTLLHH